MIRLYIVITLVLQKAFIQTVLQYFVSTGVTVGTSPACHTSSYACSVSVTPSSSADKRIRATVITAAAAVRTVEPNWTYCNAHTIVTISLLYFSSIADTENK